MADPLQDVPILNLPPGMGGQLPIGPNDDLNDDAASSQIGVHDVNVQLEQAMHRIQQLEALVLAQQNQNQQQSQQLQHLQQQQEQQQGQQSAIVSHLQQQQQQQASAFTAGGAAGNAGGANVEVQSQMHPPVVSVPASRLSAKVEMPKAFLGARLDGSEVDSWLFAMNLYFAALDVPEPQRSLRAALNLGDEAAVWLRAQQWDVTAVSWSFFQNQLRESFRPADWQQRARDQLSRCVHRDSVAGYTFAFRKALLRCVDVSQQEALYRYVSGLKPEARQWVKLHDPSTLDSAAQIAERYESSKRDDRVPHPGPSRDQAPRRQGSTAPTAQRRFRGNAGSSSANRQGQQEQPRRFSGKCFICGREGHRASECRSTKAKLQALQAQVNAMQSAEN